MDVLLPPALLFDGQQALFLLALLPHGWMQVLLGEMELMRGMLGGENDSSHVRSLPLESGRAAGGAVATLVGGAARAGGGARMPDAPAAGLPFPNGL